MMLPNFKTFLNLSPENISDQLDTHLNNCNHIIQKIVSIDLNKNINFKSILEPLYFAEGELSKFWSILSHLHSTMGAENLRTAYQNNISKLSIYYTNRTQNTDLYQIIKQIKSNSNSKLESRAIELECQDFELNGVDLDLTQKQKLAEINTQLSELSTQFENNITDSTDKWFYDTQHENILDGLPEHVISSAKLKAESNGKSGYRLTLDAPTVTAVLSYAKNRELRAIFYQAYSTRASDQGPLAGLFDNSPLLLKILKLKSEKSKCLGFKNYAELSIQPKMVESTETVLDFLNLLAQKAKESALKEFKVLTDYAKKIDNRSSLASFDVGYYSEKFKKETLSISQNTLRPYFELSHVLNNLFEITESLFGVKFKQSHINPDTFWHKDVQCFEFTENKNSNLNSKPNGYLYMDLFARPQKRGGAWMDDYQPYAEFSDPSAINPLNTQIPVAFLTCNFTAPCENSPILLTHDEVVTLFHEFGHCIHHLFSNISINSISGISGVEWDAVELPSQFMENFCWEKETLKQLSSHIETGESLSDDQINLLIQSRQFQSAMAMMRQLEFSLFDFECHTNPEINQISDIQAILDSVRQKCSVLIPPEYNRFQNSFSHIFAGGYAAGYYSYKWAEVLSADAFSLFKNNKNILNSQMGLKFKKSILERGGSRPAMENISEFLGREPSIEALLNQEGISLELV